jgi:tyrosyl-tRNA synthetase
MSRFKPVAEQLEILSRGVVDFLNPDELKARLNESFSSGKPLRVKCGFDPTAPDLHLGHTVVLQKMRQFQQLGHTAIFLIGDFTGRIGDPTGKHETRKALGRAEVQANAETYKRQVFKVLDPKQTEVRFNSEWMESMTAADLVRLAATYTLARLFEREDFRTRFQNNQPISVHEMLYPLVQGYDSVALTADVELGGHDQIFNLLVGRTVQREYGQKPQIVMTVPLLEGTDARLVDGVLTGHKMSKSLGNYIGIDEAPDQIVGKLMSISDELLWKYLTLLSDRPVAEIEAWKAGCADGSKNPRDVKLALGQELVGRYHSAEAGEHAVAEFLRVFSKKEIPEELPEHHVTAADGGLLDALVAKGVVASKREARRLFEQGAVKVDQERVADHRAPLPATGAHVVQVGKLTFVRLVVE